MRQPQNSVGVAPTNPSQINPQVHPTAQPPVITYQPAHPASQTNQTPVAAQPNDSTRRLSSSLRNIISGTALPIHSTTTPQPNPQPQPQSKPTQPGAPGAPSFSSFEEVNTWIRMLNNRFHVQNQHPLACKNKTNGLHPLLFHIITIILTTTALTRIKQCNTLHHHNNNNNNNNNLQVCNVNNRANHQVQSRPSKRIPIIDPETQSEISSAPPAKPRTNVNNNNNPPTATNSNATKQSVAMFPEIPQVNKAATDEKETTSQTSQLVTSQENSKESASTKQAKKDDGNSKSVAVDANNKYCKHSVVC